MGGNCAEGDGNEEGNIFWIQEHTYDCLDLLFVRFGEAYVVTGGTTSTWN